MSDFSTIIDKVLHKTIIPLLPLYICGTFTDMTKSGKTFAILGILWKVFLVVIIMHFVCITIQFIIAGSVSKKNPLSLIKNQVPGYTTALGTQSSAATIPCQSGKCAKNDGVSAQIRNFVVPLCAQYPHGRFYDHDHSMCNCCMFDESVTDQPCNCYSIYYDTWCCNGRFSWSSRWNLS